MASRTPRSAALSAELRAGTPSQSAIPRAIAIDGLLGIALIHLLDLPGKFEETPYLGIAFVALVVASLVLSAVLARRDDPIVWMAVGGLAAMVILGSPSTGRGGCRVRWTTSATGSSLSASHRCSSRGRSWWSPRLRSWAVRHGGLGRAS